MVNLFQTSKLLEILDHLIEIIQSQLSSQIILSVIVCELSWVDSQCFFPRV